MTNHQPTDEQRAEIDEFLARARAQEEAEEAAYQAAAKRGPLTGRCGNCGEPINSAFKVCSDHCHDELYL